MYMQLSKPFQQYFPEEWMYKMRLKKLNTIKSLKIPTQQQQTKRKKNEHKKKKNCE